MKNIVKYSILFIACWGCKTEKQQEEKVESVELGNQLTLNDIQLKNANLNVAELKLESISSLLRVSGKIDVPPQNMVSISAPLGGYLKTTKLLEGMRVRKGEVIATMEDQQYIQIQQEYLTAKSQFMGIEKEYFRQKELNQSKASSDKLLEQAETNYLTQRILVKSLSEKLRLIGVNPDRLAESNISRLINIYSPIDGYVSGVKMNIGKYASPSEVIFELVNPADIHLALTVFEKDIQHLFVGQEIWAYANHQANIKHRAKIILIGNDISADRSVIVHCHFDKYDKNLLPGMYMNAEVSMAKTKAFVIPSDGLVRFEGKQFVFEALGNSTFEMKEVTTQNSEKGMVQISFTTDQEMAAKKFVTKGAYTLLMMLKNVEEE
jgi:membrane fusion protein, heavy metal efflux system